MYYRPLSFFITAGRLSSAATTKEEVLCMHIIQVLSELYTVQTDRQYDSAHKNSISIKGLIAY